MELGFAKVERDYKAEYAARKVRDDRKEASKRAVAKAQENGDDVRGRVIGTLENGWTIHALETLAQYKAEGSPGPGGCMSSMDWMTPTEKKAYRGLSVQDEKGHRRLAIVLEWDDYNTNPEKRNVGAGYSNYGGHGVVNAFPALQDGDMYRFNHFGKTHLGPEMPWEKMAGLLGKWFVACGGVLEEDEDADDVVAGGYAVKIKRAKKRDKEAFAEAHPGEDYAYRQNFEWAGNGWEKIGANNHHYFDREGRIFKVYKQRYDYATNKYVPQEMFATCDEAPAMDDPYGW